MGETHHSLGRLRAFPLALLLVVACGASGGLGQSTPSISPPAAVLNAWKDFPVYANPRPILWLDGPNGVSAFPNDESKIAGLCDKLVLQRDLQLSTSAPAQATATWASGGAVQYPAISAAAAFSALLRSGSLVPSMCGPVKPIVIASVRLGTASITTDRGLAMVSTWLFQAIGVTGEFAYPGLDSSAYWHGVQVPSAGELGVGGSISADGYALTLEFTGETCDTGYATATAESNTAVAVAVKAIRSETAFCDHVGHPRTATVHLATPLGARVLVDESGNVGEICPPAAC